jgi:hypothetical protein
VAADRVLPGLFEDDDGEESLLDLMFPIEEGEPEVEPPPPPPPPLVTPQAIALPLAPVGRTAPRALVVFAAYALLGAAIVLFAGALRWTRARADAQPTVSPATSSMRVISAPGPTRIGGPQ